MEWSIKLEARTGWCEVRTVQVGEIDRPSASLTDDRIGLSLDEAKRLLCEVQKHIVQSQVDEQVTRARICSDCLRTRRIRDRRTRTLQTLFGTVKVSAPRLKLCACVDKKCFDDLSFSPLSKLLPDRCTPELRRIQADLGARHSFREAARLLAALLPCSPPNHASIRNRLHRVAGEIEAAEGQLSATPPSEADPPEDAPPATPPTMMTRISLTFLELHSSIHRRRRHGVLSQGGRPGHRPVRRLPARHPWLVVMAGRRASSSRSFPGGESLRPRVAERAGHRVSRPRRGSKGIPAVDAAR